MSSDRHASECATCHRVMRLESATECGACHTWRKRHGEPRPPRPTRSAPPAGTLRSVEVVERVGITYRQLDYWATPLAVVGQAAAS